MSRGFAYSLLGLWIAKVYNLLKPKREGDGDMPSYAEIKLGEYLVSVVPSDLGRKIIKGTPFYNGVDIWFDLKVKKPHIMKTVLGLSKDPKVDETIGIE